MGWIMHNAIVITGWNHHVDDAHSMAVELGLAPSAITEAATNGYRSFLVPPDGSKEGWEKSDEGDFRRSEMRAYLTESPLSWVEVRYGEDSSYIVADHDNPEPADAGEEK